MIVCRKSRFQCSGWVWGKMGGLDISSEFLKLSMFTKKLTNIIQSLRFLEKNIAIFSRASSGTTHVFNEPFNDGTYPFLKTDFQVSTMTMKFIIFRTVCG